MIAAWMLFTVGVTLLLFAGAGAAEYVARGLRAPTRFVWAAAMLAVVGLSARALATGLEARRDAPASAGARIALHVDTPAVGGLLSTGIALHAVTGDVAAHAPTNRLEHFLTIARSAAGVVRRSAEQVDVAPLERLNRALVILWIASSFGALLWLAGSLVGVRRIERKLSAATVDDHPVLLSKDVGPALFGVARSRIVLPEWVLELPRPERGLILAHEGQHAAVFDPALTYAAAVVVALQPWNVALWALFRRLRLALESDCDHRVLGAVGAGEGGGNARRYGRLLITVYERATPGLSPYVAFVERPSNLERRIRRIAHRPRLISATAGAAALVAAVLGTAAWTAAPPARRIHASASAGLTLSAERATPPFALSSAPSSFVPAKPIERADVPQEIAARQAAVRKVTAPEVTAPEATLRTTLARMGRPGRCSVFARVTFDETGQVARPPRSPTLGAFAGGCSIYGDVVIVALDGTHLLAAVRDTADAGVAVTEFFIFTTTPGSVPPNLAWSTPAGRAELHDTTFSFASPAAGVRPIVLRIPPSAAAGQSAPGSAPVDRLDTRDAMRLSILNMDVRRMRIITWDVLAQLPTAPRCVVTDRSDQPIYIIDGVRQNFPPGAAPATAPSGTPIQLAEGPPTGACFVVGGERIEIPWD